MVKYNVCWSDVGVGCRMAPRKIQNWTTIIFLCLILIYNCYDSTVVVDRECWQLSPPTAKRLRRQDVVDGRHNSRKPPRSFLLSPLPAKLIMPQNAYVQPSSSWSDRPSRPSTARTYLYLWPNAIVRTFRASRVTIARTTFSARRKHRVLVVCTYVRPSVSQSTYLPEITTVACNAGDDRNTHIVLAYVMLIL